MLDPVGSRVEPPHLLRFKGQRIRRDQHAGVGLVLGRYLAAHVLEEACAGLHVELGGIRRQMLRVHVKQDVAGGGGHVRLGVILNVIGAETKILILNFDFAVGEVNVAFLALLLRFETHAGLA